MNTVAILIPWDKVMRIAYKSKHYGELGWTIAKQIGLTDYEIRQSNVDEKIGEKVNTLMREVVRSRMKPQWVEFDSQGNVRSRVEKREFFRIPLDTLQRACYNVGVRLMGTNQTIP